MLMFCIWNKQSLLLRAIKSEDKFRAYSTYNTMLLCLHMFSACGTNMKTQDDVAALCNMPLTCSLSVAPNFVLFHGTNLGPSMNNPLRKTLILFGVKMKAIDIHMLGCESFLFSEREISC